MMEKLSKEIKSYTYKSRNLEATKFENFYPKPIGKIQRRPSRFLLKKHEEIWFKFKI